MSDTCEVHPAYHFTVQYVAD